MVDAEQMKAAPLADRFLQWLKFKEPFGWHLISTLGSQGVPFKLRQKWVDRWVKAGMQ